MQSFKLRHQPPGIALLAAVGPLQFEVVQYRLQSEYGAESRLEPAPVAASPLARASPGAGPPAALVIATGVAWGTDTDGPPRHPLSRTTGPCATSSRRIPI